MITIVDYNAGNLRSVLRACQAVGAEAVITQDADAVARAERVIFPGVGAAYSAMVTLRATGLDAALRTAFERGTPILGICLGTQVILEESEEVDEAGGGATGAITPCLGILGGRVVRFRPTDPSQKVPHMGWNAVDFEREHPVLAGIPSGVEFYFVHSFHPAGLAAENVVGTTEYATRFCSILGHGNLIATQFHAEKSGRFGLRLIENFTKWRP